MLLIGKDVIRSHKAVIGPEKTSSCNIFVPSNLVELPLPLGGSGIVYRLCMFMMQATLEWENQEDGFLAKILVGDGSKDIPVGTPVAVITEEKDDVGLL